MIPVLSARPFDLACIAADRPTGPGDLRAGARLAVHGRALYGPTRGADEAGIVPGLAEVRAKGCPALVVERKEHLAP